MASISKKEFGRLSNGSLVYSYTLENRAGAKATIITYGARIQSFLVPDKEGNFRDIVLGFDTANGYEEETFYMGAIVGPHANLFRMQNLPLTILPIIWNAMMALTTPIAFTVAAPASMTKSGVQKSTMANC